MIDSFAKEDLPLLVQVMDQKKMAKKLVPLAGLASGLAVGSNDKVGGDMSIPKPVDVDVNGTMSTEDYKACSMVMAVCQNMIQKSVTDAAKIAGVGPTEALKNMNAWVQAYVDFPLPFFNFKDYQSDVYKKNDFSLTADPDVIDKIVNIKGLNGLKDAVVGALKNTTGNMASYAGTDRKFNYFGIVTGYNETEIATRVIKFQMNLKTTDIKALCISYTKTNIDTAYDTYQFVGDKRLMIETQAKMEGQLIDYMAEKLLSFVKAFYDQQLTDYQQKLANILKK